MCLAGVDKARVVLEVFERRSEGGICRVVVRLRIGGPSSGTAAVGVGVDVADVGTAPRLVVGRRLILRPRRLVA